MLLLIGICVGIFVNYFLLQIHKQEAPSIDKLAIEHIDINNFNDKKDAEIFQLKKELNSIKNGDNSTHNFIGYLTNLYSISKLIGDVADFTDEFINLINYALKITPLQKIAIEYKDIFEKSMYQLYTNKEILQFIPIIESDISNIFVNLQNKHVASFINNNIKIIKKDPKISHAIIKLQDSILGKQYDVAKKQFLYLQNNYNNLKNHKYDIFLKMLDQMSSFNNIANKSIEIIQQNNKSR